MACFWGEVPGSLVASETSITSLIVLLVKLLLGEPHMFI